MAMSIIDRLLALIGIKRITLTFIGHEREGGYTYITCRELPGFTFMLEPGEERDLRAFIDAIDEPLMAYLVTHFKRESMNRQVHLTSIRHSKAKNFVAELGYA